MSKRPGRPGDTRSDLVARGELGLQRWAEALLEERRQRNGAPLEFPEPPTTPSSSFDEDHQRYYLELLAATDSKSAAAAICGFSPSTISQYAKTNPEFDRLQKMVVGFIKGWRRFRTRGAMEQRGIHGYNRRPVTVGKDNELLRDENGDVVYTEQYSDTALKMLAELDFREELKQAPLVDVNVQTGVVRLGPKPSPEEYDDKYLEMKAPQLDDDIEVKE